MRTTLLTKILIVAGIAMLAVVPFLGLNQFWVFFLTISLIQTILLASLNLALGYTGLMSLGHPALYAVGGYATAYFTVSRGAHVLVGIAAGVSFGILAGLSLALTALRTRAVYFGIITLAFLFLTSETVSKAPALGSSRGIHGVPGLSFFGESFTRNGYYWFALVVFVLAMVLLQQLSNSALGRSFVAVRENEDAAASLGVNVGGAKAMALGVSGALAGLAGALFAHLSGSIFPEASSFLSGLRLFVGLIVGGVGTFAGPIVGMGIVQGVDRFTVDAFGGMFVLHQPTILMVILIVSLVAMRNGVVGTVLLSRLRDRFLTLPKMDDDVLAHLTRPIEEIVSKGNGKMTGPILHIEGLAKRFGGVQALAGVDLTVSRGSIHGLIGPNGSGKSTFVNLVSGFIPHDAGIIEFDGHPIEKPRPHAMAKRGLVRIFQRTEPFGRLLVIQNVLMGLHLKADRNLLRCMLPLPGRRRRERELGAEAYAILASVGLAAKALQPVAGLPYGEQRMLEVARAVAARPKLLILDEPATGLTKPELERLAELLRAVRRGGLTILIIEHNMEFLMDLVDSVTVLDYGRCIAEGAARTVQKDPQVIEAYLGEPVVA